MSPNSRSFPSRLSAHHHVDDDRRAEHRRDRADADFRGRKGHARDEGTALTEDAEFREIYKLPVEVIPSNKPVQRVDHEDLVYRTIQAKYNAVADDVERRHAKGQPVLVGTVSIESSEKLSAALTKRGIAHEVLNAKHHEREAHIVAQAGRYGAVTIATNMAGRGTDILLGGNPDELVRERSRNVLDLDTKWNFQKN